MSVLFPMMCAISNFTSLLIKSSLKTVKFHFFILPKINFEKFFILYSCIFIYIMFIYVKFQDLISVGLHSYNIFIQSKAFRTQQFHCRKQKFLKDFLNSCKFKMLQKIFLRNFSTSFFMKYLKKWLLFAYSSTFKTVNYQIQNPQK